MIKINKPLCFSEIGQKPNQEDALFPSLNESNRYDRIFLICDGMGGHEHGEIASNCVATTIGNICSKVEPCSMANMKDTFNMALSEAYKALDELDDDTTIRKMGTTIVFLAFCTDGALIAHIGDSRVYQLRPQKGIIFQTRDHSLVNDLIASGEITEEEAKNHPQRHVITRVIQPHQEYQARPTFKKITDIKSKDIFFLCSDGILEKNDSNELQSILLKDCSGEEKIATLCNRCKEICTSDNNSCYYVEVAGNKKTERWSFKSLFNK